MKKKNTKKKYIAGIVAAGVALLLYSAVFPLRRLLDFLIGGGLAVLIGWLVSVMAGGLDTSKKAPAQRKIPQTGNETVDSMVIHGQDLLAQIRRENDLIEDESLSIKVNQLEEIANRIFQTVADQPSKAPQIRRFMEYYLPTTLKMMTSYRKLDERQVAGENASATRQRVQEAMDVVLRAFKKQLDQMYNADMLDISTDIDVLETMLKQDGLMDSGLHGDHATMKKLE